MTDIYALLSNIDNNIINRKKCSKVRHKNIVSISSSKNEIVKLAFDTRRINQEVDFNPRRGLQNYHRSEAFISENLSNKLKSFAKLRNVLNALKEKYGKEYEWQDSYARVLLATLDRGLRTDQNDGDFSEAQPSMGSLDYIEQLLQVRYRIGADDIGNLEDNQLAKIILAKDENLLNRDINLILQSNKNNQEITKTNKNNKPALETNGDTKDTLIEKLFGGVRASKENPEIERVVSITIKDKFGA